MPPAPSASLKRARPSRPDKATQESAGKGRRWNVLESRVGEEPCGWAEGRGESACGFDRDPVDRDGRQHVESDDEQDIGNS